MKHMRVCYVWDAEYPWDVRVEKVTRSLVNAGHDVHIVARNRDRRVLSERLPEGTVHRMPPMPMLGRRLDRATQFPAFFNPRWARAIVRTARETSADVIIVRDLPLAPTAIWAARRLSLPVMMDMAENYPAMMRALWETGVKRRFDIVVRNPEIVRRVERWSLRHLDHIVVVVEESRDRLVEAGYPTERITVACNTPLHSRLDELSPREHRDGQPLSLIYLGLLEAPRGVAQVIDAIAHARRRGHAVNLTVLGNGREAGAFQERAQSHGLAESVRFLGHVPYTEAVRLLQRADVGIVPHLANESWNTTIPNKLFDYMAAGLAVLTSHARPAARIVRETGAGRVYTDTDVEGLADAMIALSQAETRQRHGAAGRLAVHERYHWELDASRMVAAVEQCERAS
jgi:glycosyltransferase involved in cell wall biosynthesis